MKNFKKILASLLAVSMVASFASFSVSAATSHAYGTVIYEEDFEDIAIGNYETEIGGYMADSKVPGLDNIYVGNSAGSAGKFQNYRCDVDIAYDPAIASPSEGDNKVFKVYTDYASACHNGAYVKASDLGDDGKGIYLVEYDVYTPNVSWPVTTGINLQSTIQKRSGQADYHVNITGEGKITSYLVSQAGGASVDGITDITANNWIRMAYVYNPYDRHMQSYVNGQYMASYDVREKDVMISGALNPVAFFAFLNGYGTGARQVYFDNIKITRFDSTDVVVTSPNIVSATGKTGLFYSTLTEAKGAATTVLACQAVNYKTTGTSVVTPVAAAYKAGQLVAVLSGDPVTVNNAESEGAVARTDITLDVGSLVGEDADEIKLFVWDGLTTMVPVGTTVTIK